MAGIINSFLSLLENNYQDEFNNQNNKLKKHSMYSTRNLGCVQNFNVEHRPEKSHPKASSADLRLVTLMRLSTGDYISCIEAKESIRKTRFSSFSRRGV